jgi:outer membrane protein assembly factor BamE (lipoprotein component of BamABCDE complex)
MKNRMRLLVVAAALLGACAQPGTGFYRPDLTDDIVARVSQGQSGAEVTTLLGTPYQRIRFDNLKSTAWDYRFRDTWGYWVDLSVMIGDDGRVVNKVLRRIEPPDRN